MPEGPDARMPRARRPELGARTLDPGPRTLGPVPRTPAPGPRTTDHGLRTPDPATDLSEPALIEGCFFFAKFFVRENAAHCLGKQAFSIFAQIFPREIVSLSAPEPGSLSRDP